MERERLVDVPQIDGSLDLAVGVARDVREGREFRRPLVQTVDREDRKELVDRPGIRQGLEDRKVENVLVREHGLHVLELFRDFLQGLQVPVDPLADLPEDDLSLRAVLEREMSEVEEREQLLLVLQGVVVALPEILGVDLFQDPRELLDDVRILRGHPDSAPLLDTIGDVEHVRDQDRVKRRHRAAGLGHQGRRRHVFLLADRLDRVDDVVGVLLYGVVHRRVERGLRTVVVDAQAAAQVQVANRNAERPQLRVHPARFADGVLDFSDVGDLRADVEVQHHHRVEHAPPLQDLDRLEHLRSRQAELRRLAAGLRPLSGAARVQLHAHPQERLHPTLPGDLQDPIELRDFFEDQHDLLLHPDAVQGHADQGVVLVSVADDERVGGEVRADRGEQLRFGSRFEAVTVGTAGLDDLFDHDPLLVDLDREDAAVDVAVLELFDRASERVVQVGHCRGEDLREPDDDRRADAAQPDFVDDLLQGDAAVRLPRRADDQVAVLRDVEETFSPVRNAVQNRRVLELLSRTGTDGGRHGLRPADRFGSGHETDANSIAARRKA